MNWKNYIHNNSNRKNHTSDCQLVTCVNAYYHLTGNIIKQNSVKYKELSDLCGCVAGSCINIRKAWKHLNITEEYRIPIWDLPNMLKSNLFIEVCVWHKMYGFHSAAIVDYDKKLDCVRMTNFKYELSRDGWMFFEDLRPFLIDNVDNSEPRYVGRTFKVTA